MKIISGYVGMTEKIPYSLFLAFCLVVDMPWRKFNMVNLKHLTDKIKKRKDSSTDLKNIMNLLGKVNITVQLS